MYLVLALFLPIMSGISQVLMKKAALIDNRVKTYSFLFIAYSILLLSTVFTVYVLKFIAVKYFTVIIALNFLMTIFFSRIFLKEKINKNTLVGTIFIFVGVCIFSIK